MKQKLLRFFLLIFLFLLVFSYPKEASADFGECRLINVPINITTESTYFSPNITIDTNGNANPDQRYDVYIFNIQTGGKPKKLRFNGEDSKTIRFSPDQGTKYIVINHTFDANGFVYPEGEENKYSSRLAEGTYYIGVTEENAEETPQCSGPIENPQMGILVNKSSNEGSDKCIIKFINTDLKPGNPVSMRVEFTSDEFRGNPNDPQFDLFVEWEGNRRAWEGDKQLKAGEFEDSDGFNLGSFGGGSYTVKIRKSSGIVGGEEKGCSNKFWVNPTGGYSGCKSNDNCRDNRDGKIYCRPNIKGELICTNVATTEPPINPCDPDAKGEGPFKCQTAIGEISTTPGGFLRNVLVLILSLSGGIIILLIIVNGYKLIVSQGDPEKVKEARESLTSAIAGLLLIIFSIVIMQFITVDVLRLPGFE